MSKQPLLYVSTGTETRDFTGCTQPEDSLSFDHDRLRVCGGLFGIAVGWLLQSANLAGLGTCSTGLEGLPRLCVSCFASWWLLNGIMAYLLSGVMRPMMASVVSNKKARNVVSNLRAPIAAGVLLGAQPVSIISISQNTETLKSPWLLCLLLCSAIIAVCFCYVVAGKHQEKLCYNRNDPVLMVV